eukprot:scaffold158816_cov13-Prasinocladus_malaysianus.AAC.1
MSVSLRKFTEHLHALMSEAALITVQLLDSLHKQRQAALNNPQLILAAHLTADYDSNILGHNYEIRVTSVLSSDTAKLKQIYYN